MQQATVYVPLILFQNAGIVSHAFCSTKQNTHNNDVTLHGVAKKADYSQLIILAN